MDDAVYLTLFVTRETAVKATKSVINALAKTTQEIGNLTVIDVAEQPEAAEQENILVIPCLKIEHGEKRTYFIGDVCNPEKVMRALAYQLEEQMQSQPGAFESFQNGTARWFIELSGSD